MDVVTGTVLWVLIALVSALLGALNIVFTGTSQPYNSNKYFRRGLTLFLIAVVVFFGGLIWTLVKVFDA